MAHRELITTPAYDANGSNTLKVMSYNVLADKYATGERSSFPHCPPEHLAWPSRLRRILGELLEAAPDALCLQEVEAPAFRDQLLPVLAARGYAGAFAKNDGGADEPVGVAIFWRDDKFRLVARREWSIAELAKDKRCTQRFISEPVKPAAALAPPVAAAEGEAAAAAVAAAASPAAPLPAPVPGVWSESQVKGHWSLLSWLKTMKHVALCVALVPRADSGPSSPPHPASKRLRADESGAASCGAGSSAGASRLAPVTDVEWAAIEAAIAAQKLQEEEAAAAAAAAKAAKAAAAAAAEAAKAASVEAAAAAAAALHPAPQPDGASASEAPATAPAPAAAAAAAAPAGPKPKAAWKPSAAAPKPEEPRVSLGAVPEPGVLQSLSSGSGRPVLVGNCHAFWNPRWPDAKAMQLALWTEAIDQLRRGVVEASGRADTAVVLCGDLNTVPRVDGPTEHDPLPGPAASGAAWPLVPGVYALLTEGHLPHAHAHHPFTRRTREMYTHTREGQPDAKDNKEQPHPDSARLTLPLRFVSAHAAVTGGKEPRWTNLTARFSGCLDYVFVATHALDDDWATVPAPSSSPSSVAAAAQQGGAAPPPTWTPLPGAPVPVAALAEPRVADIEAALRALGPSAVPVAGATGESPDAAPPPAAACPNALLPSDHIPVVVTLAL